MSAYGSPDDRATPRGQLKGDGEIIERAAAAVYERGLGYGAPESHTNLSAVWMGGSNYVDCRKIARAAIAAIREPTTAMCEAAMSTRGMSEVDALVHYHSIRTPSMALGWSARGEKAPIIQAYSAMIDSALAVEGSVEPTDSSSDVGTNPNRQG